MTTTTRNEAAERLHTCTEDCLATCPWCNADVDHTPAFHLAQCRLGLALDVSTARLAAERRATVERIRDHVGPPMYRLMQSDSEEVHVLLDALVAILDEEDAR